MNFEFKDKYDISDLKLIMQILRSDDGCPWDREQTHMTIRNNFIEETYEVIEAIDENNPVMLREELGDVLLQIIFHSQIEAEKSSFQFDDVVNDICDKLIIRHPHIFSDTKADSTAEVLHNWTIIKNEQKGHSTASQTLDAVPKQLPALMRAQKVQGRAKKSGLYCPDVSLVLDKLKNEIAELEQLITMDIKDKTGKAIGDTFLSITSLSNLLGYDGEEMLCKSTNEFIKCFSIMESLATKESLNMSRVDFETLSRLWEQAKMLCIQEE